MHPKQGHPLKKNHEFADGGNWVGEVLFEKVLRFHYLPLVPETALLPNSEND